MKQITVDELKGRLEKGDPVSIVDIREAEEFREWHIHGSRNLPVYDALRAGENRALIDGASTLAADRPIVTVCRRGIVSEKAATLLGSLGFDAVSLEGGIRGWSGVWSEARVPLRNAPAASLVQIRRNGKGCLSYLLGSAGEAAVFDPSVDSEVYTRIAAAQRLRISRVVETHVHADHLSRARDLCRITGATLTMPRNDRVTYEHAAVRDGDEVAVGDLRIRVVATPGHTGESVSYLVGQDALLTGDTLFVDAVGRPDLERGDAGARSAAHTLHDSLQRAILGRFGGEVLVCPAHHGSGIDFDGEAIVARLGDLGTRLAILGRSEDEFVTTVLASLGAKPPNFETIIAVNEGKAPLADLDPLDVEAGPNRCVVG
jgi:glyoxylase-like metal-dependent hydrolase (beta-lactamase superfamily II)/rhodanese-related sulfurtransferase